MLHVFFCLSAMLWAALDHSAEGRFSLSGVSEVNVDDRYLSAGVFALILAQCDPAVLNVCLTTLEISHTSPRSLDCWWMTCKATTSCAFKSERHEMCSSFNYTMTLSLFFSARLLNGHIVSKTSISQNESCERGEINRALCFSMSLRGRYSTRSLRKWPVI